MKLLLSLIILFEVSSITLAQGWEQLDDFPSSARDDGATFTINSIAYCGTGLDPTWNYTYDFFAFDMTSETWTSISGLPINQARQYANGFASETHGYLFGGVNGSGFLNDLWKYDPLADSWEETTAMPALGRTAAATFVIGDTAYIVAGRTANTYSIAEVWAFCMSDDSWTQKNDLPDSLWRSSGVAFQGKGYVLFGADNEGNFNNKFYEYTPISDSWTEIASFPGVGRTYAGFTVLDDELALFAGRDSLGNSYNDFWKYSIPSDSWTLSVNLPANQRRGGMCFSSNTALYYTTGIDLNDVRLKETWKYDLFLETSSLFETPFTIYPNPAVNSLTIISSIASGNIDFVISTLSGRIVQEGTTILGKSIRLNDFQSGNYLITLRTGSEVVIKKIVIL